MVPVFFGRRQHRCPNLSTLSLGQDEVDFETFQARASNHTLALDVLLELQNEELFEFGCPRSGKRVAAGLVILRG